MINPKTEFPDDYKLFVYWDAWSDELELIIASSLEDAKQIIRDSGWSPPPDERWTTHTLKPGMINLNCPE